MIKEEMALAIKVFLNGSSETALKKFEELLSKNQRNIDLLYNYGCILGELELYEKEQKVYREILKLNPYDAETLINLSVSLNATKEFSQSIAYANKAIRINDGIYQAYEARGIAKLGATDIKGGLQDFKKWINLILKEDKNEKTKDFLVDCIQLINIPPIYEDQEEIEDIRNRIEKQTDNLIQRLDQVTEKELASQNIGKKIAFKLNQFYLGYQQKNDKNINERTVKILKKLLGNKELTFETPSQEKKQRKKIGIISTFQFHPKLFIFDQIKRIDRSKYDIEIVVLNNKKFDASNEAYYFEHHMLKAETYDQVIQKIKAKNYDIVFIPDIGMSIVSRILSTEKLAVITVTSWLHPVTSGSNNVDIFLSGALMEGIKGKDHYSEKLVTLPGIGLKIEPNDYLSATITEIESQKSNDKFLIGCIQTPFKYHPRMDDILINLARKITNSVFIFIKLQEDLDNKLMDRLRKKFILNNVDPNRINLIDRMEKNKYISFLKKLHIAIDTLGWSGGNTALDSIGAGLPSLTIEEDLMRANHTAGIYKMIGINELIYENEEDLIRGAYELSIDNKRLKELKKKIIHNFSKLKTDHYISDFFNTI
jgi:predicted O-linked N-acetylglucosamine transferase (SPINDLY family)